jgi:hypothetical protein
MPIYVPDEPYYGHLARSLADGHGMTWRGDSMFVRAALYVYLIVPAWWVASGVRAFEIAKVESVILTCLVAAPVWWLARRLVSRGLALMVVVLSLSGTWMVSSGSLMTESVGIPLSTACLATLVQALREPQVRRWPWISIGFAALAAASRLQLVVLLPIVLLSLMAEVVRSGDAWRARLRNFALPLGLVGFICASSASALLVLGSEVLGSYESVSNYAPGVGSILNGAGLELLELAPLVGIVPLAFLAALAWRPAAWRDETLGPLLAVLVPAVMVLALESGYYIAGSGVPWSIQRYVVYVAPMLLLFGVVAFTRSRLVDVTSLAVAVVVSMLAILSPAVADRTEQRALFATADRVDDLLPGVSAGLSVALVGVLLLGAVAVIRLRGGADRARSVAPIMAGGLLLVLTLQTATAWTWEHRVTKFAGSLVPRDLAWVDHHSRGPVGVLEVTRTAEMFYVLDAFNTSLTHFYATHIPPPGIRSVPGRVCGWRIPDDGVPYFSARCGAVPHEFLINDPISHLTFYDEVASTRNASVGRIVEVRGVPRLKARVDTPCERPLRRVVPVTLAPMSDDVPVRCNMQLTATLWLDTPGIIVVGIRGSPLDDHRLSVGGKLYRIPAGGQGTLRLRVGRGRHQEIVDLDWGERSRLAPAIVSVELVQDGRRQNLL